jgi:hypothetical protein
MNLIYTGHVYTDLADSAIIPACRSIHNVLQKAILYIKCAPELAELLIIHFLCSTVHAPSS